MQVASVQCDVKFGQPELNTAFVVETCVRLKADGCDLAVFPEAVLTGYCANSLEEARAIALPESSPYLKNIQDAACRLDMLVIAGYIGQWNSEIANCATLFGSCGPQTYRKAHLPFLGVDRFVTPGDELSVFDTPHGKIGLQICFDVRHPEGCLVLSLKGADMVVIPTNWPTGAAISADVIAVTRAVENHVFVMTCNRVGEERTFSFIGRSKIIDPDGKILAGAEGVACILSAEIDLTLARNNASGKTELRSARPIFTTTCRT